MDMTKAPAIERYLDLVNTYRTSGGVDLKEVWAAEEVALAAGAAKQELALARGGRLSQVYLGAGLWKTIVLEGYQTNA
jgi:hypothetical protein